jgi:hypothetical protein
MQYKMYCAPRVFVIIFFMQYTIYCAPRVFVIIFFMQAHSQPIGELNNLEVFGSKYTKGSKQETKYNML